MLIKCVLATDGSVLELGAGPASTPVLHWLCQEKRRRLYTYESNNYFYRYARCFESGNHKIFKINWDNSLAIDGYWSVILVDQPSRFRSRAIEFFKDKADYIVIHDTDDAGVKRYAEVLSGFKYRHDWKACRPWTTVVSNFKDTSWLTP
jgi:hypothetical protein